MHPAARLTPLAARCIAAGALLMLLGVALGAFGAHVLQARLPAGRLATFQTAVNYHVLHALGLLAVGLVAQMSAPGALLRWSARLLFAGIVLFSGSLYALVAGAPRWLGMVTPLGGAAFMTGWALLAGHALARSGRTGPG